MEHMEEIEHAAIRARQGSGAKTRKVDDTWLILLGAVATVCGTIAAILSVPDDFQPRGALFWPAVWCSFGLLAAPLFGLRKSTQRIFRTENLLMVGLVYWLLLEMIQGAYPLEDVSYDDVILAFTAIGTMGAGIWVGMLVTGWSPPQFVLGAAKQEFSSATLFGAALISFFLGMFYFAYSSDFDPILMIDALGWCRFCAPWSTGEFGGWEAFAQKLEYFGYLLPSLTVLLGHREGWMRPKTIVSTVLSIIVVLFLAQGGGRRVIGVTIGAALILLLVLQRRVRPKVLIVAFVGATILLMSMEAMLEYRQYGFSNQVADYRFSDEAGNSEHSPLVHVDDNFLRLSQIVHFIPDVHPYVGLQPLFYVLTLSIPRVLWPDKPSDPGYNLTELLGWSGVSLSASIIAELYAMHGLIVVFLGGLVFGGLANMWNKILALPGTTKSVIYAIGVMVLFAGIRSMLDLVFMSYGLLAWLVMARLLPRTRGKAVTKLG